MRSPLCIADVDQLDVKELDLATCDEQEDEEACPQNHIYWKQFCNPNGPPKPVVLQSHDHVTSFNDVGGEYPHITVDSGINEHLLQHTASLLVGAMPLIPTSNCQRPQHQRVRRPRQQYRLNEHQSFLSPAQRWAIPFLGPEEGEREGEDNEVESRDSDNTDSGSLPSSLAHILVQNVLKRRHSGGSTSLLEFDSNDNSSGLTEVQIDLLPCRRHATHTAFLDEADPNVCMIRSLIPGNLPSSSFASSSSLSCAICCSNFEVGEEIRILPCNHEFHSTSCIDRWLALHFSCPMCKATIAV